MSALTLITTQSRFKPRPNAKGGGTRGRICAPWPELSLVVGYAVWIHYFGTDEAARDRVKQGIGIKEFAALAEVVLPSIFEGRKGKNPAAYLKNRIQTMFYSGSADRKNKRHDPRTRAAYSKRHPSYWLPVGHPYHELIGKIRDGRCPCPINKDVWEAKAIKWKNKEDAQ